MQVILLEKVVNLGNLGDVVTATGTLGINDVDADDSPVFADTTQAGVYGSLALVAGAWTYTLDQSAVQDLDAGDVVTDVITLTATDGTTQAITITITGSNVFGNAEGAYGANVNLLIDNARWDDEDDLAETYSRRKGFAYGCNGRPVKHAKLLQSVLAGVELAYQNLDSVELGVTTIDTYFDTLGGISRAVKRAKTVAQGADAAMAPVYIGDQTHDAIGSGTVRSLSEQVALETRTRMLNPKWYEGMLEHGYEGVRQIEVHLTNTMGWSATTGQVQPWVYQQLSETFVLDPAMRERLGRLNPTASVKVANRLLEAHRRQYWTPDAQTLEALQRAGEELEDRLEGAYEQRAAA